MQQTEGAASTTTPVKEENKIKQAWHSLEEALHLREPTPPPVPPKDERWLVRTVSLSVPQEESDPGFWDKIVQRITMLHAHPDSDEENTAVSLSVPADAAIQQLGIPSDDAELQDKHNYFKRMAARCKEKFDEDSHNRTLSTEQPSLQVAQEEEESQDSESNPYHHRYHLHLHRYFQALHRHFHPHESDAPKSQEGQHAQFVPKVDPKEMEAAHRILYRHERGDSTDNEDDDRKLFGSWWGWRKRSKADKEWEKQLDSEWEKIDFKSGEDKKRSLEERNGDLRAGLFESKRAWWKPSSFNAEASAQQKGAPDRKAITKRHQAIASAAAYEAVKEYHTRKAKQGKKVSHSEMKAILAGMAMAEAIKLLESHHDDDDDDDDDKDETVAEAGSTALKLFELLR